MRVAFTDPQGLPLWRRLPYLGPSALFLFACLGPLSGTTALYAVVLAIALFSLVGILPFRQRRARTAELVTGPGFVVVKNAGTRSQRIDAKAIVGGTTARTAKGILFTLSHAQRDQPIEIEVESEADAERLRLALGIGHGGFGTVGWRTTPSSSASGGLWGRLMIFLMGALVAGLGLFVNDTAAGMMSLMFGQFAFIGMILSTVGYFGRPAPPSIVMAADGLHLQTKQGPFTVPYDHVQNLEQVKGALRFTVPAPYNFTEVEAKGNLITGGMGESDSDGLIKQVMSAAARARGLGVSKMDVMGRVDVLRRNGESPRSWLARLDMTGQMLDSTVAGYRGHTLDHDDLWSVLEDPEADWDIRAAAARVLRHSPKPETRIRIDAAVAAVRDESVHRRLRIAILDDVDNASQELAVLDAQEPLVDAPTRMQMR